MKFFETSELYLLNKSTYINLRWIAYFGQLCAVLIVQFFLQFEFNYLACISIIFLSIFLTVCFNCEELLQFNSTFWLKLQPLPSHKSLISCNIRLYYVVLVTHFFHLFLSKIPGDLSR